jgi:hypothetical protein
VSHHLVSGEIPQLYCPLFPVVLKEVSLKTDVFGLLIDYMILGVRNGALVVLPYGGGVSDMGALKISPTRWRRWSPSLVASAGE